MFLSIVFWQQSKNRIIYGARFISALFFPAVPLQSCPEKSQIWGHGDRLLCCLVLLPSSMVPSEMTEITRFIQVFSSHLPAWQCCLTWLANCKLLAAWETVPDILWLFSVEPQLLCCLITGLCDILTTLCFCLCSAASFPIPFTSALKGTCPYRLITPPQKLFFHFYLSSSIP